MKLARSWFALLALGCGRANYDVRPGGAPVDALGMDAASPDAPQVDGGMDASTDVFTPDAWSAEDALTPDAWSAADAFTPTPDAFAEDARMSVMSLGPSHYFAFDGDGVDSVRPAAPPLCADCTFEPSSHGFAALVNTPESVRAAVPFSSYSVSVWFRIRAAVPPERGICRAVVNGTVTILGSDDPLEVSLFGPSMSPLIPVAVPAATWTHVAYTFDVTTNELRFYVRGVLRDVYIWNESSSLAPFTFGCFLFPIDELATFERVLTPSEIAQLAAL